jgi:hypothetical protein
MPNLLVICPSRGRPELCKQMFDSFNETEFISELLIITDTDDPKLKDYDVPYTINPCELTTVEIINIAYESNRYKYDYFMIINDDFIFHTKGWDYMLVEDIVIGGGWGIASGRNGMNEKLPMTSVVSANILECTGWLVLPTLEHLCGDLVWRDIGEGINKLHFNKKVYIEHKHFMNLKRDKDATDEKTNSDKRYKEDNRVYRNWYKQERTDQVQVVLSQMRKSCKL